MKVILLVLALGMSGCSYFTSFEVGGYEALHSASLTELP